MTFTEIKTLLDAGFTKEEILTLDQDKTQTEKPIELSETVPENDPVEDVPETVQAAAEPDPIFTQLNENIGKLIKTIQSSNLANNSVEKPGGVDLNKTVDSIMESIIRPTKGGN